MELKSMSSIKPNLIVIGVGRAGTTSLFKYLGMHPEICASSKKEIGFFTPLLWGGDIPPLNSYNEYFHHCDYPDAHYNYYLEASPGYFAGAQKVVQAIVEHLGTDVTPILMLREPVSRIVSYYHYQKSRVHIPTNMNFNEFVTQSLAIAQKEFWLWDERHFWGIKESLYSHYIESWLKVYGHKMQVVFFDDFIRSPEAIVTQLCDALNLSFDIYRNLNFYQENPSFAYKNSGLQKLVLFVNGKTQAIWMRYPGLKQKFRDFYFKMNARPKDNIDDVTITLLQEFYKPHNENLSALLKKYGFQELPDWL